MRRKAVLSFISIFWTGSLLSVLVILQLVCSDVKPVTCNSTAYYLYDKANGHKVWSQAQHHHRISKKDSSPSSSSVVQEREIAGGEYGAPDAAAQVQVIGDTTNDGLYPHYSASGSNGGGGVASAYHYQFYPDYHSSNSFGNGYHHSSNGGWSWNQRPGPIHGGNNNNADYGVGGSLNNLFSGNLESLNFDSLLDGPLSAVLGVTGVKGAGAGALKLLKLGFFFLSLFPLFHLIVVVPVTAILVILILLIPFPVYNNQENFPGYKSFKDSTELIARQILTSSECVERVSCQLSRVAHDYGKESWIHRIKKEFPSIFAQNKYAKSQSNLTMKEKFSRGFSSSGSSSTFSCEKFVCNPIEAAKKVFKF